MKGKMKSNPRGGGWDTADIAFDDNSYEISPNYAAKFMKIQFSTHFDPLTIFTFSIPPENSHKAGKILFS